MSNEQSKAPQLQRATKKVEVTLTATTCVEYTEIVEVPADISPEELNQVVNKLYETVGAGEYRTVGDSWERGSCGATDSTSTEPPAVTAVRTADGISLEDGSAAQNLYAAIRQNATFGSQLEGKLSAVEMFDLYQEVSLALASTNGDVGPCVITARQLALLLGSATRQVRVYEPAGDYHVFHANIRECADYGDRPEGQLDLAELAELHTKVEFALTQFPIGDCTIYARQLALLLAKALS